MPIYDGEQFRLERPRNALPYMFGHDDAADQGSFKNIKKIAAYIEKDSETGLNVGIVPAISGAHTQGETLDELYKNLKEVLELCLEEMDPESLNEISEFVDIQEIEVGR